MMDTFFSVSNSDLERLMPDEAVDVFRELIWAEASSNKIGINLINVPSAITVADGGIDAEARDVKEDSTQGIIKAGLTRYQIKTGSISLTEGSAKDILLNEKQTEIKSRIKSCLDKGGTLVIVFFGVDNPETRDNQFIEICKKILIPFDSKYSNAKIEIWRQNNIIGFLRAFPSLALFVNGRDNQSFQTHSSWSKLDDMDKQLKIGKEQEAFITNMQTELRRCDEGIHIRIYGEPGVGKTRLVLEATKAYDLMPLVIYCDTAEKFRDSSLMNEILMEDNNFSVLLVIDECDSDDRSYIWNKLKHSGPRIKLVTIYNEPENTSGSIKYYDVPSLNDLQITEIIQSYSIPKDVAERWSDICSGSPRVAHVIGLNLKNNPDDLLRAPDTVNVWRRYVSGSDNKDSDDVRERYIVLKQIALFKRFGYGARVANEAKIIAAKLEKDFKYITWPRFQEIIKYLKSHKILQGENTLYITPKALHIKLWIDWWDTYGVGFDLESFTETLTDDLKEWFFEMFEYAAASPIAQKIVKDLFSEKGPLHNQEYLKKKLGAKFFAALSKADPVSALNFLKRTIRSWDNEELLQFTDGRREVVWALERIAILRECFSDAARLLLALGEAENETWSNNASGVFTELFTLGYGHVASSEALPHERLPILKEALESNSNKRQLLAIRACNHALESEHWTRMAGVGRYGLNREPLLWMPKTYGELYDAFKEVWQLLRQSIDNLPHDAQQEAANVLLNRARGLGRFEYLVNMVIDTLTELSEKSYIDKKTVLAHVIEILHYEGNNLPEVVKKRWEHLRDTLTGSGYSALMKRYIAMDLLSDQFDENGELKDKTKPLIKKLAEDSAKNLNLLIPELKWLVTEEAKNGYIFGYELGQNDVDFHALPLILEALRNSSDLSDYFVGGYFNSVYERNRDKWESELDKLIEDSRLSLLIPGITWRSGLTDQSALRILKLAKTGRIQINSFGLFAYGGTIRKISENVFNSWIEFLLDSTEDYSVSIALELHFFYYVVSKDSKTTLPEQLTYRILRDSLFQKQESKKHHNMNDYHWTVTGKAFVATYPEKSLKIAEIMIEHFGEKGTIVEDYYSKTHEVINLIARKNPEEVWEIITRYLGPPIDSRAFHIRQWLRGGEHYKEKEGALTFFTLKSIWEWIDGDAKKRAPYLAGFVPNALFKEDNRICLAREVLSRYGSDKNVRHNFTSNFSSETWWGSESLHIQNKKEKLLVFKNVETDKNVILWIDEYISYLDARIESAKIREERETF